tara:strand:+ start:864 stop:1046 length:183 start_codon:yes stop_codon:yes gene_type:complete
MAKRKEIEGKALWRANYISNTLDEFFEDMSDDMLGLLVRHAKTLHDELNNELKNRGLPSH